MAVRLVAQQVHLQMLKDQMTIFETLPLRWNSWMGWRLSCWNCGLGMWASKPGGSCSLYKLLLACSFLSPVLAECKLLRQQAQERHWPVAVCFLFFCVCGFLGRWMWGLSKRSFCQEPVLCCQSETWLMLNHFIGWEGKCSTDHWVARYLSLYLCTLLCFPRAFFPFSP